MDALYFTTVTMSTVGYGDLSPSTTLSRAFTSVYILIGIGVVFYQLAKSLSDVFEVRTVSQTVLHNPYQSLRMSMPQWIEQSIRFFLRMTPCWPSQPEAVDLDGDGEIDYTPPQELMQLGRDIRRDRAPPARHRAYARPQPPSWRVSTATPRRRSARGRTTCARPSSASSCSRSSSSSQWSSSRYAA